MDSLPTRQASVRQAQVGIPASHAEIPAYACLPVGRREWWLRVVCRFLIMPIQKMGRQWQWQIYKKVPDPPVGGSGKSSSSKWINAIINV